MKQIVSNLPRETELVTIKEMFQNYSSSESIIAYVTRQETGLGISTQLDNGDYGFYYHKDLIKPYNLPKRHAKYIADTKTASLQKVLDAGRELLIFDSFKEFTRFAVNYTKL